MARLFLVDRWVAALVKPFVRIGDMAGGAAGAAVVAALLAAADADMAALALLAGIGDAGLVRMLGDIVDIHLRHLLHLARDLVRMRFDIVQHVLLIGAVPTAGSGPSSSFRL